ncbi:basic helix-loop-helix protein [Lecanora helva]
MSAIRALPHQERADIPMDQPLQPKSTSKRKRDPMDHNGDRKQTNHWPASPPVNVHENGHNTHSSNDFLATASTELNNGFGHHIAHQLSANASPSTAAAALAANMPQLTVPQPTELSFPSSGSGNDPDRQLDSSFDMGGGADGDQNHHHHPPGMSYSLEAYQATSAGDPQPGRDTETPGIKPAVGTDEWHKVRKDNHKEVERRRRETINEGINELAKIVPNCEKNKGSILQRGVQYITQLKENETRNIEKWTLEKLLTDQAIAELSSSVDRLKNDLDRAYREVERWKKTCQDAGLEPKGNDASGSEDNET